ncbi:TonB-dependent receptor protein:Formate dehydrogenase, subunit FdhD [Methanococcus maripaludis S2]|uniref:TonB-dependent receptor protein:Formate dehydrogenase, subunit FdhD n=2 Tax=Methanococcus maripaludis TaxID=39152 RepID=Q6LXW3_METMP|nr:TonB-dependent receptor protein:Formate dehydrogenase, subunit FdhD [Methanococcus maripaludis S2]
MILECGSKMSKMVTKVKTYSWSAEKGLLEKEDTIVTEDFYELYLDGKLIETMVVSPEDIEELGIGYTISEGYIVPENFSEIKIDGKKIYVNSKDVEKEDTKNGNVNLKLSTIKKIMETMPTLSDTWKITGGVHWAALFDFSGNKIVYFEDIGRHNAVDKVVGYAVLNDIVLNNCVLASSGRQPTAMVKKVVNSKIPVIITKSPSTDKGVILAKENDILLIGFARIDRFTVYNGVENIDFKS